MKVLKFEEYIKESYDGTISDFEYEFPLALENQTGSSKAILRISKKGEEIEVRTKSYISEEEIEKAGNEIGAKLVDYKKSGSIAIAIFESNLNERYITFKGKTARDLHKALLRADRKDPEGIIIYTSIDEKPYNIHLDDLEDDLTTDIVTLYGDDGESVDSEVSDIIRLEVI